jgi:MFS family permease
LNLFKVYFFYFPIYRAKSYIFIVWLLYALVEFTGITHALVWATATAYFAQSVPEELKSTAQGILQGLHFGLGRGCGALLGGVIVDYFGLNRFLVYL